MVKELDLPYDDMLDGDEAQSEAPKKSLPVLPLARMVLRRWPFILGSFGVCGAAAYMAASNDPSLYAGSFRLLVEPVTSEGRLAEPTALTRTQGGIPGENLLSLDYPSQLEILRSEQVLEPVYAKIQEKYPNFTYIDLVRGLTVQRSGGTSRNTQTRILDVGYQADDPQLVMDVLEALSEKYLNYSLEDRKTRISEGVSFIEEQLPELQQRVDQLQSAIQQLQQNYQLLDPGAQGSEVFARLNGIGDQQLATQQELQELRALYTRLQRQLQLTPDEAIAVSALSQDTRYQQVLGSINEVEAQIAVESTRWGEQAPPIQRLQQQRASLYSLLSQRTTEILGNASLPGRGGQPLTFQDSVRLGLVDQLVTTANQIQILEVRNQVLAQNRATVERQAEQFPGIAREYQELQRQLEIATRTLDQLLSQRETLRVAAAQSEVPWELIATPSMPMDSMGVPMPISGISDKKLLAGAAFGLAMGVAIALLIERKQDQFYDIHDIKDLIAAPRLGVVPVCLEGDPSTQMLALASSNGQIEELSEQSYEFQDAFDQLHANIKFLNNTNPVRSLVVCSANAGDGKTTTAFHLAQTAAATGQRVLLVDANFRHASLHRSLGLPNTKGLVDILRRKVNPDEVIQTIPDAPTLRVLTTGPAAPGSTRLLASPHMKSLMRKLASNYDLVIYDSPNLTDAVDANFLGSQADGVLMVVSIHQSSREKVMKSVKKLKEYKIPVLGTVANRAKQGVLPENMPTWEEDDELHYPEEERLLPGSEEQPVYTSLAMERTALVHESD